ncbi:kinase-like protein [Rhizopogon salebrosus TDB-379]|nr:kinase-like protein [Rhizopogon salebrosus TDB-379]
MKVCVGWAYHYHLQRIRRELKICAKLKHPNILHVHGYTSGFGPFMAIVSPWAEKGNLTTYLEDEKETNLSLIRRFLLVSALSIIYIVDGLQYLHTNNIIHGDLTGPNVLIHGNGTACLADFGLSVVASWTSAFHGNFRWMAPELLGEPEDDKPVRPSKYSDIYSFGSIMLQVLTSKIPYQHIGEAAVTRCIYTGVEPSRERYPAVSEKYWHFIEQCWSTVTKDRPSTERVVEAIDDELDSLSSSRAGIFCIW